MNLTLTKCPKCRVIGTSTQSIHPESTGVRNPWPIQPSTLPLTLFANVKVNDCHSTALTQRPGPGPNFARLCRNTHLVVWGLRCMREPRAMFGEDPAVLRRLTRLDLG